MKRVLLALLFVVAAAPAGAATVVTINQFKFFAADVTVPPGTEVTWVNDDDEPHIVSAVPGPQGAHPLYRSPALDKGERFSFVFKDPGTYRYYCTLHPHMVGTVVVTAK
jgi:plastocyanin